jgi:hypothetical protein
MNNQIIELLFKIIDSDISKDAKEKILLHYMLPKPKEGYESEMVAPIEKIEDTGRVGTIKRPSKKEIDMRNNPKLKEEFEAMAETLEKLEV